MYFISDENGAAIPMPNIFTGETGQTVALCVGQMKN